MSDILNNIILILIIVDKTIVIIEKIKKPSADNTRQKQNSFFKRACSRMLQLLNYYNIEKEKKKGNIYGKIRKI